MTVKVADPLKINERLYKQISELLKDVEDRGEDITMRERVAALIAIGRVQTIFIALRKEHKDSPDAGATVRKYSGAFAAKNANARRAKNARAAAVAVAHDPDDDAIDDALADRD